jgi:CRISPR-associated endoribonuclease Cas6
MRVRVTFSVKNKGVAVPFHHQYLISQVIKGLTIFSEIDKYNDFDLYSFSGLKGQTRVSRAGLHYTSRFVTIVFSSPSREFMAFLISELFKQEHIEIGQLQVQPEKVDEEMSTELSEEMKYICISPLVLVKPVFNADRGKVFIDPTTDEFSDIVYESTLNRMAANGIKTDEIAGIENFQLIPDQHYISKMYENQKKFARIYPMFDRDVKFEIRGYTFPFTLHAPKEIQAFVYTCGLGQFAQKGFGLLDIANTDPVKRAVPFEYEQLAIA